MKQPLSDKQIWSMPIGLGLLTVLGLISALVGDGVWDTVSWILLATPILVIASHILRSRASSSNRQQRRMRGQGVSL